MEPPARKKERVVAEPIDDEVLVYDLERDRAHRLNRTAALVWRHCDGQRTVGDLTALLQAELDPVADEDLVRLTLDHLSAAHLLESARPRSADQVRTSRRQFVRKVGLVGALSLLLPVVTSITAPTVAQAQSGACTACTICTECAPPQT
jgi:hypothetical protein